MDDCQLEVVLFVILHQMQFPQGGTHYETGANNPTACAQCGCYYRSVVVLADLCHRLSPVKMSMTGTVGRDAGGPQIGPLEFWVGKLEKA